MFQFIIQSVYMYFILVKLAVNKNLEDIVTPVQWETLQELLLKTNYDRAKTEFLTQGFKYGFSLNYKGNLKGCRRLAPNLKLRVGSKVELWNKVMNEVELGRYAGPFEEPPFETFVQLPIGLVPKDKGLKTRLIFHLSYPKDGDSVNAGIPHEACTVKYPDFDEAVKLCIQEGEGCYVGKSDMSSAFRHVPMAKDQWWLLVMKAEHPISKKIYYFMDKCLPFGSSTSCAIFQAISDAIAWIVSHRTNKPNVNYLDDYLFAAALKKLCDLQIEAFLQVCKEINFPVALEKTYWGETTMTFLGMLLDTIRQVVGLPMDKLVKAANWVEYFLNKRNKKATVLEFQKLCGILNFLCRAIVPGRAFLRRLYIGHIQNDRVLKAHHHVKITEEHRLDLLVWRQFLKSPESLYRPFIDVIALNAEELDMYSDASGNFSLGFGAYCGPEWMFGQWDAKVCNEHQLSIEYLELFAVLAGVLKWIKLFANKRIILFCDNEAVVKMINNSSSSCKKCMVLLRMLVAEGIIRNVRIFARHVRTNHNGKADALSRLDFKRFWRLAGNMMNEVPSSIPQEIWPMNKLLVNM